MAATTAKWPKKGQSGRRRRKSHGWSTKKKHTPPTVKLVTYEVEYKQLWEITAIKDERTVDGVTEYLVDWEGEDENGKPWEPSWCPAEGVKAPECLKAWQAKKREQNASPPRTPVRIVIRPRNTSLSAAGSPGTRTNEAPARSSSAQPALDADGDVPMDDLPEPDPQHYVPESPQEDPEQDFSAHLEENLVRLDRASPSAFAMAFDDSDDSSTVVGPSSIAVSPPTPPTDASHPPSAHTDADVGEDEDEFNIELYYPPDDVIAREQDPTHFDAAAAHEYAELNSGRGLPYDLDVSFDLGHDAKTSAFDPHAGRCGASSSYAPPLSPTLPPAAPFLTGAGAPCMSPPPEPACARALSDTGVEAEGSVLHASGSGLDTPGSGLEASASELESSGSGLDAPVSGSEAPDLELNASDLSSASGSKAQASLSAPAATPKRVFTRRPTVSAGTTPKRASKGAFAPLPSSVSPSPSPVCVDDCAPSLPLDTPRPPPPQVVLPRKRVADRDVPRLDLRAVSRRGGRAGSVGSVGSERSERAGSDQSGRKSVGGAKRVRFADGEEKSATPECVKAEQVEVEVEVEDTAMDVDSPPSTPGAPRSLGAGLAAPSAPPTRDEGAPASIPPRHVSASNPSSPASRPLFAPRPSSQTPLRRVSLGFPSPRKTPLALTHTFGL